MGVCHNNKRESSSFAITPSLLPRESQWTQLGVQASRFFCSDAESRLFQNRIAHSMLCYKWSCSLMYHKGLSLLEQTYLSHSFCSGMFCIYLTIYSPIGISFFFPPFSFTPSLCDGNELFSCLKIALVSPPPIRERNPVRELSWILCASHWIYWPCIYFPVNGGPSWPLQTAQESAGGVGVACRF